MFYSCIALKKPTLQVSEAVHKVIAEAVFSYVSMISVTTILQGSKTVSKSQVDSVEQIIEGRAKKKQAAQKGGMGCPYTGLASAAYGAQNSAGVMASSVNFAKGIARPAHVVTGTWLAAGGEAHACSASIRKDLKKEVRLILKDQKMRKSDGVVDYIVGKIEGRLSKFLHPLVSKATPITVSDVKRSSKSAFRGLRIILL